MEQIKINAMEIIEKLTRIQKDMDYLKEYIEDITLTEDDLTALEESEKEFRERKTVSHEELKKELSL